NTANGQTRVTTTGEDGSYRFSLLQPGAYSVKFEARGFAVVEVPSVQIAVTETPVLNQSLSVGSETQTVTVEAEAEIIQTASSTVGNVVASATVAALPSEYAQLCEPDRNDGRCECRCEQRNGARQRMVDHLRQ